MLKKILRGILVLFLLLLIAAGVAIYYVNDYLESNQEKLLQDYMATKGTSVAFREVRLELWKDWPEARLTVDSLVVRDTTQAHRVPELINAQRIRAQVSMRDLFKGRIRIQEIRVSDAYMHLESDSAGVFNLGYIGQRDTATSTVDSSNSSGPAKYLDVEWEGLTMSLDNVDLKYIHPGKNKRIELLARDVSTIVDRNDNEELMAKSTVDFHVNTLAFNTEKGSYLSDSDLSGPLNVTFAEERIKLEPTDLNINGMPLHLGATFEKAKTDTSYIDIASAAISYDKALAILPRELQDKLSEYYVSGEFPAEVSIATPLGPGNDPRIEIGFHMTGQDVKIKEHRFQNVFAQGSLVNRLAVSEGGIPNSKRNLQVRATNVKARYLNDVLIETPYARVKVPGTDAILQSKLHISGAARSVGTYLRNDAFFFRRGTFTMDADINYSLRDFAGLVQSTDGRLDFYNTEVFYGPAGVSFPFRAIHTIKRGEDIRYAIASKPLRTGFAFDLDGRIQNIVPLLIDLPTQRIVTDVNFHTERFDWKDFRALFGEDGRLVADDEEIEVAETPTAPRKKKAAKTNSDRGANAGAEEVGTAALSSQTEPAADDESRQVAAMKSALLGLEDAFHPNFNMKFDTVKYYDVFTLTDFTTGLHFNGDTLVLERSTFDWADSEIRFGARVDMDEAGTTPFKVDFLAEHLDLNKVRGSLDYFGVALPDGLDRLPSDLHIDFKHRGRMADSIGIVPGYNFGTLNFDDGRDKLFSGNLAYAPSDTPGGLLTKVHLNGDPQVVNVLFAAENFFFGEGAFTIDLDLDGTPEDLPSLLKASTLDLSINDSRVHYLPGEVYLPIQHFDVRIADERADYSISMVTDSTNRTIHMEGYMDQLTAFMFPDSVARTGPFQMKADVRAAALSYPDIVSLIQTRNDRIASKTDTNEVSQRVKDGELAGAEVDTATTPTLRKILSATGGVFNSFRPDLSLKVDTFTLSPRTTLLDLATGMRVRNGNELVLERTGFLINDGKVELDAIYALDSLAQSPFHVNYRIENIDLDQLIEEVAKVNPDLRGQVGNVAGKLNLNGEMNGLLDEKTQRVVFDSTMAVLNYDLRDIVLTDWEQLIAVGKKAKMGKRFERLALAPLTGTLRMEDGLLPIPRMEIQTTALQLFIEGEYSLEHGPDLLISVPVWSNIGRGVLMTPPHPEGYALAGWKVYLTMQPVEGEEKPSTKFLLSRRKYAKRQGRLEEYKRLRTKWKVEKKAAKLARKAAE